MMMVKHAWLQHWRDIGQPKLLTENSFDIDPNEFQQRVLKSQDERNFDFSISQRFEYVDTIDRCERGEKCEFYARLGSAIHCALHDRLIESEAGYSSNAHEEIGAASFPSGMAAIDTVIQELMRHQPINRRADKHFIRGANVYIHSKLILDKRPKEMGFGDTIVLDTTDPIIIRKTLERYQEKIIAVYFEPITNPLITATNVREIATISQDYNVPVVVDNTFLTPYLVSPKVSMGEKGHMFFSKCYQNPLKEEGFEFEPGLIRFAIGREPRYEQVIDFLNKVF